MKVDVAQAAAQQVEKGQAFAPPLNSTPNQSVIKSAAKTALEQRVLVQIRVPKSLHRKLKQLALDDESSIQDILESWIRDKVQ